MYVYVYLLHKVHGSTYGDVTFLTRPTITPPHSGSCVYAVEVKALP